MRIALDYDGTYTRDPRMWDYFIANAVGRGHTVKCVTMRYPHEAIEMPVEIIYTSRRAKRVHCDGLNEHFDVWIDDNPVWVDNDAGDAQKDENNGLDDCT